MAFKAEIGEEFVGANYRIFLYEGPGNVKGHAFFREKETKLLGQYPVNALERKSEIDAREAAKVKNIIITGASSGLGKAICDKMRLDVNFPAATIWNWSTPGVDVSDYDSVSQAAFEAPEHVDILINCAGINLIDYLPNVTQHDWDRVMDTNAKSIFLTTQALLHKLVGGTVLNIVSNAATVAMTSSLAYGASKAAALLMTKQLARELKKTHDVTVFSVSPNKLVGTGMSEDIERRVLELRGWTTEEAKAYQLAALPAGAETPPEVLAEFIAFLLSSKERHRYLNGCDITYGGPN